MGFFDFSILGERDTGKSLFEDTIQIFLWIVRDLINSNLFRLARIVFLEVIGTTGLAACLGGILGLLRASPHETIVRFWLFKITIPPEFRLILLLILFSAGLLFILIIYSANRLCITVAVERTNQLLDTLLNLVSSSDKVGWQSDVTFPFRQSLRVILTSGIRALGLSGLRILKSINQLLYLVIAGVAMFWLWNTGTILLLPIVALYAVVFSKISSNISAQRRGNFIQYQGRKKLVESFLRRLGEDRPAPVATKGLPSRLQGSIEGQKIDRRLFQRHELDSRLKNLNSGAFFIGLVAVLAYWWHAGEDSGLSLKIVLVFLVAMHLVFRSLSQLTTTLAFVSRLSDGLKSVLGLLELAIPRKKEITPIEHSSMTNKISIPELKIESQISLFFENRCLAFSPGETAVIIVDEPVNRLSLPAIVFLLEKLFSLKKFQLFDAAVFLYEPEDIQQDLPDHDIIFAGIKICREASFWDRDAQITYQDRWIFCVVDGVDLFLEPAAANCFKPETKCLVISEGDLQYSGILGELLSNRIAAKKLFKKTSKKYSGEENDDII